MTISHFCPNGDLVTKRFDDPRPCPFCGYAESKINLDDPPTDVIQ